jgi:hypothetical protein
VGRLIGVDLGDRDQREAGVADFLEQAVQGGLVGHRAEDERGAVGFVGEAQSVEPGDPSGAEVPLDANLVRSGLVMAERLIAHGPPSARKLEGKVMSGHHHMW